MRYVLPLLLIGSLAGCDNDPLCASDDCVSKSHADCAGAMPRLGRSCDFEGVCFYCTDVGGVNRASQYACAGGEYVQEAYALNGDTCEGPADTGISSL